jgi:HrpA-like RNA helicase
MFFLQMLDNRACLPISQTHDVILDTIAHNRVTIIRGETGSGKTTQVPQYLLDSYIKEGRGAQCNIIVTQVHNKAYLKPFT